MKENKTLILIIFCIINLLKEKKTKLNLIVILTQMNDRAEQPSWRNFTSRFFPTCLDKLDSNYAELSI